MLHSPNFQQFPNLPNPLPSSCPPTCSWTPRSVCTRAPTTSQASTSNSEIIYSLKTSHFPIFHNSHSNRLLTRPKLANIRHAILTLLHSYCAVHPRVPLEISALSNWTKEAKSIFNHQNRLQMFQTWQKKSSKKLPICTNKQEKYVESGLKNKTAKFSKCSEFPH